VRVLQEGTQYLRCGLTSAEYRGTITSLLLLATLFLIQARMPLAFLATWAHCWLMFSWLSTRSPRSFFPLVGSAGQHRPCPGIEEKGNADWLMHGRKRDTGPALQHTLDQVNFTAA